MSTVVLRHEFNFFNKAQKSLSASFNRAVTNMKRHKIVKAALKEAANYKPKRALRKLKKFRKNWSKMSPLDYGMTLFKPLTSVRQAATFAFLFFVVPGGAIMYYTVNIGTAAHKSEIKRAQKKKIKKTKPSTK